MKQHNERVKCADGFGMSVQAHEGAYCEPRGNDGPYTEVEIGYPSDPEIMIMRWAEDKSRPTDTVYGWVPAGVVRDVIVKHGGAVSGEVPEGVVMLMAPALHSLDNLTIDNSPEKCYIIGAIRRNQIMQVGDLVKINPIFTDEAWIDVVFVVLEIAAPFAVIFANGEKHKVEMEQLEAFSGANT